MIFSPLSEVPMIGRSPTFGFTLLVFFCFQFAVIYAKNFGMLMAFRFLTDFFSFSALATGGAVMGDLWGQ
jgi:MFS transporter, DHA1 family, multidrug resistance protein